MRFFNNFVCAIIKDSDQPVHTRRLNRAFAGRLNNLWLLNYLPNLIWGFLAQKEAVCTRTVFQKEASGTGDHVLLLSRTDVQTKQYTCTKHKSRNSWKALYSVAYSSLGRSLQRCNFSRKTARLTHGLLLTSPLCLLSLVLRFVDDSICPLNSLN